MSDFKPEFKIGRYVFWLIPAFLLWIGMIIFCIRIFLIMLPVIIVIGIISIAIKSIVNRKIKKTYQEFKNYQGNEQSSAASSDDKIIDVEVVKD